MRNKVVQAAYALTDVLRGRGGRAQVGGGAGGGPSVNCGRLLRESSDDVDPLCPCLLFAEVGIGGRGMFGGGEGRGSASATHDKCRSFVLPPRVTFSGDSTENMLTRLGICVGGGDRL